MARDYRVRILSREDIAKIAMAWWSLACSGRHSFNICKFVLDVLPNQIKAKGKLVLEFYDQGPGDAPAYVTFNPLTLHVDHGVWDAADRGEPYARYIIAHEIGHLVLHDRYAVAFSEEEAALLSYVQNEESAEWQAHVFAALFLVPDHIAIKFNDADLIAGLCVVTDSLAASCLDDARNAKFILTPSYEGEMCPGCGNFTLTRDGIYLKCDTCGSATGCL
ncbi:ImmA/IrrE family metallo-endopeptidase [Bradyrhizobium arachidis]|uniref:ImmA/IrrE family metallo-endopeptidase n=1 Tax=Bradyrhizobium arachidis TaxID=858423 RepID=UPI0021614204|nr:ImmA/IrrE family metallo-endopeptidase [Bradyrhizobium arachidis]UVO34016.1 ImmA/IrrE family metallo-endopeptidase [Bradyrhizobium arachidis]